MPVYGVNLAITLGITVSIQLCFFLVAYLAQFDKVCHMCTILGMLNWISLEPQNTDGSS